jgi:hypothetical protein
VHSLASTVQRQAYIGRSTVPLFLTAPLARKEDTMIIRRRRPSAGEGHECSRCVHYAPQIGSLDRTHTRPYNRRHCFKTAFSYPRKHAHLGAWHRNLLTAGFENEDLHANADISAKRDPGDHYVSTMLNASAGDKVLPAHDVGESKKGWDAPSERLERWIERPNMSREHRA